MKYATQYIFGAEGIDQSLIPVLALTKLKRSMNMPADLKHVVKNIIIMCTTTIPRFLCRQCWPPSPSALLSIPTATPTYTLAKFFAFQRLTRPLRLRAKRERQRQEDIDAALVVAHAGQQLNRIALPREKTNAGSRRRAEKFRARHECRVPGQPSVGIHHQRQRVSIFTNDL